jgi:uncharacterized protein (TIGR03067 family)
MLAPYADLMFKEMISMSTRIVAGILAGSLLAAMSWSADAQTDSKELKGTWQLKSEVKDGEAKDADYVKSIRLSFDAKGDWAVMKDDDTIFKGTTKLDTAKKPQQIDMTLTSPEENKGIQVQGIYEIKGDTFRICWTINGERPTEFEAKEASGRTYAVFQRVKSK